MKHILTIFCLAGVLCTSGLTGLAHSAEPAQSTEDNSVEERHVESHRLAPVTVTAEKRKEDLQTVTNSVTAISEHQIDDAGIRNTFDVGKYAPNFHAYETTSRSYFSIFNVRGIANTSYGDPSFTMYIDDIPVSDFYNFNQTLFDVERIEILRGPQGTLYGQNTAAGVMNIITKQPDNTLEGKIEGSAGTYETYDLRANIRGPIFEDKLFFSLAGVVDGRDGYIKNLYDDRGVDYRDTLSGRGQLRWTPTSKWDIRLSLSAEEYDDGGWSYIPWDKEKFKAVNGGPKLDDFETNTNHRGKSDLNRGMQALRISYEAPWFNVYSITARHTLQSNDTLDADFTATPLYIGFDNIHTTQWSQEIRLASNDESSPLSWIGGLFYSTKDSTWHSGYQSETANAFGAGQPAGTRQEYLADFGAKTYATFGKVTYRFFDKALGVSAGLRFEHAERSMDREVLFAGATAAPRVDESKGSNHFLPKIAVDYRFSPELMAYASIAKGYKTGGYSHAINNPAYIEYDPETLWTYELGMKSTWLQRKLVLNLAGFHTDVSDFQDLFRVSPTIVAQRNIESVSIWGADAELNYRPVTGLDLMGSVGFVKATYGDFLEPSGQDYSGNQVLNTPEFSYNLAAQYRFPFGLYLRGEVDGNGGYYFDRANDERHEAYAVFNFKTGYESEDWSVKAYVNNIFNKEYHTFGDVMNGGIIMGNVGAPRIFGATATYRF